MRPITASQNRQVVPENEQVRGGLALADHGALEAPPAADRTAGDSEAGKQGQPQRWSAEPLPEAIELPLRRAAAQAAAMANAVLGPRVDGHFGILTYHRVAPRTAGAPPPRINVTPDRFEAQMRGLLARGYRAWPLRRMLDHCRAGRAVPPKTFLVTFDDGWECIYRNAWPVLRELAIPATIFVTTAFLDSETPFPFDPWTAAGSKRVPVSSWRPLSIAHCREMLADELIDIGSHTHTHTDFRDRPGDLGPDLARSLEVLKDAFGLTEATFAFPYGYGSRRLFGAAWSETAKGAGALCALTTESVPVRPDSDPFDWGRFYVDSTDTAATLAAKLNGWYSLLRQAWLRARGSRDSNHRSPDATTSPGGDSGMRQSLPPAPNEEREQVDTRPSGPSEPTTIP